MKCARTLFDLSPSLLARQTPDVLRALGVEACPPSEREALDAAQQDRAAYRRRGRTAQAAGRSLEAAAHTALDAAQARGLVAWWRQTTPEVRWIAGQPEVTGRGLCDVVGALGDGRVLVVEVKRGKRIYRDRALAPTHTAAIAAHQAAQLDATARAGGVALLAVDQGDGLRWVRWRETRWPGGVLERCGVQRLEEVL